MFHINISWFRVTIDGVCIGEWIYWPLKLTSRKFTGISLISTIHKSPQYLLSLFLACSVFVKRNMVPCYFPIIMQPISLIYVFVAVQCSAVHVSTRYRLHNHGRITRDHTNTGVLHITEWSGKRGMEVMKCSSGSSAVKIPYSKCVAWGWLSWVETCSTNCNCNFNVLNSVLMV
jgi:hypothetical protein